MIVLDTNIISEIMKTSPASQVLHWINRQEASELFITTITVAEVSYGINALPEGNRRLALENAFNKILKKLFKYSLISFDEQAANLYGKIMSHRKKLGRPISSLDGQIAAIALAQGATIATRNIRDFSDCDLDLLNPFE